MDQAKITLALQEYRERLAPEIVDAQFLVWGSVAAGQDDDWSDLDVVVVSESFSSWSSEDRQSFLFKRSLRNPLDIDPWAATPTELEQAPIWSYIGLARETGFWANLE